MRFVTFTRAVRIHIRDAEGKHEPLSIGGGIARHKPSRQSADVCNKATKRTSFFRQRRFGGGLYNSLVQMFKRSSVHSTASAAADDDDGFAAWRCNTEHDEIRVQNASNASAGFVANVRRSLTYRASTSHRSSMAGYAALSSARKNASGSSSFLRHSTKPSWSSEDTLIAPYPDDVPMLPTSQKRSDDFVPAAKARAKRRLRRFTFTAPSPFAIH
ncbi:hypothetical protein SYNPS1DRAFT_27703 [Syncephalis pseudoplumigaleata]|uniref:Uncharacterized protein n=1 Tax=Syncephalis pseudoplumigaleata TaxID=1712513 RepID=A0A4V1J1X9_9FUNG|nr:hypothetical protein SYNPS1DRAFT_27703 [Syncephalis pseudoplumigaleata]|eukprot:RKP26619.1 hypothetical protein SYNPS1DRAFT_27703 [Syncephalis pseudoplumigaleata]